MNGFDPAKLTPRDAYRLLISLVVPRPIAWVSTLSAVGVRNLAPFSFFNAVGNQPLTVMVSIGARDGQPKDTLANVLATGEFVLSMVDERLLTAMNATSGDYPPDVDEFDQAGLTPAASVRVRPPRVGEALAALECRVSQIVPVEATSYTMVLGRVEYLHVDAAVLRPNGLADSLALRPVGRLGGDEYATVGTVLELARPRV